MAKAELKLVVDNSSVRKKPLPEKRHREARRKCPFYGFIFQKGGVFKDTGTNICGLARNPVLCFMERQGNIPNWNSCDMQEKYGLEIFTYAEDLIIFPREFCPKGETSWQGMVLSDWMKIVQNRKFL